MGRILEPTPAAFGLGAGFTYGGVALRRRALPILAFRGFGTLLHFQISHLAF